MLDKPITISYNFHAMTVYSVISVINLIVLAGIIAYHIHKKQKKAVVFNTVLFIVFGSLRLIEINYVAIRTGLLDLLGSERFNALRQLLNKILFFSSSIMVGVQLVMQIISIVLFVFLAANAAVIFIRKSSGKIFQSSVLPKDEKTEQNGIFICPSLYLMWGKLLI